MTTIERFRSFHETHPEVCENLVRLARRTKAAGLQHYSIKALYEVARWQSALGSPADRLLLNNNYTAFYARMIMSENPDLAGFFSIRRREA